MSPPLRKTGISFQGAGANTTETNRAIPQASVPSPDQRLGNYKTVITTQFTKPGVEAVLYQSVMPWTRVRVMLETAGPVVIGSGPAMAPIFSGKGALLQTNVEMEFVVASGNKVWVLSTTANRIRLITEPLPWLEQILGGVVRGLDLVFKAITVARGK